MKKLVPLALLFAALSVEPAFAYIGPGAGLSAIGTLVAIVVAAIMAVVGFVWYPVKRLLKGKPAAPQPDSDHKQA
ncbi:MAG: hypothetical protein KDJ19_04900 [Hyphomicrobiaceae bacterium]|nr:hypothetical protein [Hyphomicrobiaceae bacterium]MCC0025092.1 hypothetical protein [Hyphomicrobiaceae bacterium]